MKRVELRIFHALIIVAVTVAAVAVAVTLAVRGPVTRPVVSPSPQQRVIAAASAPAGTKAQAALPCPPPPGEGVVGACTPKPVQVFGSRSATPKVVPATVDPPVCIPDVSSWQGSVDWGAVKRWQVSRGCRPAGIFKMGEYVADPWAAHNNSELARLGMWRSGYWFLRNTGCAHEAQQIIAAGKAYGLKVVVLDDETPEARGYDGCLTPPIRAAGFIVAEYASPGAYPGGTRSSNPAWIAAYGPANPPAAPWGGPIKAFQCSDGIFGCVTFVPGVGRDDVSVDFGITSLGVGPSAAQVRQWIAARGSSLHAYYKGFHLGYGCHIPVLTNGFCGLHAWRVDHFQKLIDTAHGYYPRCFGRSRDLGAAECRIVRPAVAVWSRAAAASLRAECPARTSTCDGFRQRVRYFDARINRSLSTSRL